MLEKCRIGVAKMGSPSAVPLLFVAVVIFDRSTSSLVTSILDDRAEYVNKYTVDIVLEPRGGGNPPCPENLVGSLAPCDVTVAYAATNQSL